MYPWDAFDHAGIPKIIMEQIFMKNTYIFKKTNTPQANLIKQNAPQAGVFD